MEMCQSKENICSLMGELCQCDYRIRLGENSQWYSLSRLARNRVNDFSFFVFFI
jgi:hypothetical protein